MSLCQFNPQRSPEIEKGGVKTLFIKGTLVAHHWTRSFLRDFMVQKCCARAQSKGQERQWSDGLDSSQIITSKSHFPHLCFTYQVSSLEWIYLKYRSEVKCNHFACHQNYPHHPHPRKISSTKVSHSLGDQRRWSVRWAWGASSVFPCPPLSL